MSHRIIQIHIRKGAGYLAQKIKLINKTVDTWPVGPDGLSYALLVRTQDTQTVTDRGWFWQHCSGAGIWRGGGSVTC